MTVGVVGAALVVASVVAFCYLDVISGSVILGLGLLTLAAAAEQIARRNRIHKYIHYQEEKVSNIADMLRKLDTLEDPNVSNKDKMDLINEMKVEINRKLKTNYSAYIEKYCLGSNF